MITENIAGQYTPKQEMVTSLKSLKDHCIANALDVQPLQDVISHLQSDVYKDESSVAERFGVFYEIYRRAIERVPAPPKKKKLECPLCENEMTFTKGTADNSGCEFPPSANCICGFTYHPNVDTQGQRGESGWDQMYRKFADMEQEIYAKLGVE